MLDEELKSLQVESDNLNELIMNELTNTQAIDQSIETLIMNKVIKHHIIYIPSNSMRQ